MPILLESSSKINVLESGLDPFYVSVLMGHKAGIGVEKHYYRPDAITGANSLVELYAKKAAPYLTISEENRLKLKNLELEMRRKEDEERYNLRFEVRDKVTNDSITSINDKVVELLLNNKKMQQEIEELKKNPRKQSE